jgi:class 3 adenylate cyclase
MVDEVCVKYPCVHIVRRDGDCITGCCGLFDYEDQKQDQAEQAVLACAEFCMRTDSLKEKLGLTIRFRIGAAMGGPLTGCCFDPATPVFDLMGEPVFVADKLSRVTITKSMVQVNEDLQDLLSRKIFGLEEVISSIPDFPVAYGVTLKA